jgi:hypothetical protein
MTYRMAFPMLAFLAAASACIDATGPGAGQCTSMRPDTDRCTAPQNMSRAASAAVSSSQQANNADNFPRSGALHVTKNCSQYTRLAGGFCTLTSSNLAQIEAGSKVIYATAADLTLGVLDSDVVLDSPGPGNNMAFGHVHLALVAGVGTVTFSGGTGKFTHFSGTAAISRVGDPALRNWAWDGSYSFDPRN